MCLNAESLIICLILVLLSFHPSPHSRCPHKCGSTWGRLAEAVPWPVAGSCWADWRAQSFFNSLGSSLPSELSLIARMSVCQHRGCPCYQAWAMLLRTRPWPPKLMFSTNPAPRVLRMYLQDPHVNVEFHSEMPSDLITLTTLGYKKQVAFLVIDREKNLSQKHLLTFHINKWEERKPCSSGKWNRDQQSYLVMGSGQQGSHLVWFFILVSFQSSGITSLAVTSWRLCRRSSLCLKLVTVCGDYI